MRQDESHGVEYNKAATMLCQQEEPCQLELLLVPKLARISNRSLSLPDSGWHIVLTQKVGEVVTAPQGIDFRSHHFDGARMTEELLGTIKRVQSPFAVRFSQQPKRDNIGNLSFIKSSDTD